MKTTYCIPHAIVHRGMALLYLAYCCGLPGWVMAGLAVVLYALADPVRPVSWQGLVSAVLVVAALLAMGLTVARTGPVADPAVVYPVERAVPGEIWVRGGPGAHPTGWG